MVVQIFLSSVLESVKTILPIWQLLSTAFFFFFTLFLLLLSHSFLLWIKGRVGRREQFKFPSFWPHSCSAFSPSDRAAWYHEKMFLYHSCNCFPAERLFTQIQKHLITFQWVPRGGWKRVLVVMGENNPAVIYTGNPLPSNLLLNNKWSHVNSEWECLYQNWLFLLFYKTQSKWSQCGCCVNLAPGPALWHVPFLQNC